ncbi:MAG: FtsX-like permease family protein [Candidatus Krumholzibacteriia bacterium]
MRPYLARSAAAQLRRGKTLLLLTVFGVALGVGSAVAIQVLNQGALLAFAGSVQAVSGEADLSVLGRAPTLDEELLVDVLADPAVAAAWPLYRVDVAVAGRDDLFLEIVGLDLFAPVQLPLEMGAPDDSGDSAAAAANPDPAAQLAAALARPGWVALTPAFAAEMGWERGDTIRVSSGSRQARLEVGALVDFARITALATRKIAVMDIAQAQALFGRPGRIHQIDVRLAPGHGLELTAARLERALGAAVLVQTPEQRNQEAAGLLEAFRLNLTALSLISVFVGLFLIYTSVQASLVRRRGEFGLLRSLGATRQQLLNLVLAEAALLGAVGTAAGIPLGHMVAVHNVEAVSATLTNIYLLEEIERLTLPPLVVLLGVAIGVGGAVLGALAPALDMSRRDITSLLAASSLHVRAGRSAPRLAVAGAVIASAGVAWFAAWGHTLREGGFVLGFLLLVVLPLLAPMTIRTLCARVRPRGFGLALSVKNLTTRLQATSSAVAALAVTVSMMVGITLLVESFRTTLVTWLDVTLRADVYVTSESWVRAGSEAGLRQGLAADLAGVPGVRALEQLRGLRVRAGSRRDRPDERRLIQLSGLTIEDAAGIDWSRRLPLMTGDPQQVAERLRAGDAVVVSEPLARKEGLAPGDTLVLAAPGGEVGVPIVGVTYDYSTEGGSAFAAIELLERHFGPGPAHNVALWAEPDLDPQDLVDRLKAHFGGEPLVFRSNRTLRGEVLAIFDQTFAITRILVAMALLIAVTGISLTLLVQARERAAELALWRVLGALRRQVFLVFLGEGLGMGILGLLLGMVGGLALAALLILVINRAYFGWTIRPAWPVLELAQQAAVILAAAVAASAYPALRGSRTPATELSREDLT